MKKSIIATGAASLALAAMPMAGVFADPDPGSASVEDHVTVVIAEACSFQATANNAALAPTSGVITRHFSQNATLGSTVYMGDSANTGSTDTNPITIEGVCNAGDGTAQGGTYVISAVGSNGAKMVKSGSNASDPDNIETGLATSGEDSAWAMMITSANASNGYNSYAVVPTSATEVAAGNANSGSFAFTPKYRVYVGTEQASGTYEGIVTYTIASDWN